MSDLTESPANRNILAPRSRAWSTCLALLVLWQTLWVPFHLATERHFDAAAPLASTCLTGTAHEQIDSSDDPLWETHPAIDHELAKARHISGDPDTDGNAKIPPDPWHVLHLATARCGSVPFASESPRSAHSGGGPEPRAPPAA